MIQPDENPKPINLEGGLEGEREENQEEVLAAAQTDKVVRGVNGSLTPKARKLRPLAGIILIALVVLAAAYMRHGLANRHKKTVKQTETQKVGAGPATTVEKGLLSDQTRSGLNTGQSHVPDSSTLRSSILNGETPAGRAAQPATSNSSQTTSIPPLEYRQSPVSTTANGSLSYAEQRRLDEYNREREAMEAPTSVKGNLPGTVKETVSTASDPLGAIQSALLNARSMLSGGTGSTPQSALAQAGTTGTAEQRSEFDRQNDQEQKTTFGRQYAKPETEYLAATRQPARSPYEIDAGWLIPAVLEQQLNSDLPGMIRALVRENVYDSATGGYILIPSGSTLIGIYNSHVGYGQNALQAVWQRIVFPDGSSLALGGFEGDDSAGAAGFRDQVNNHWGRLLSGALLTSVFAAGIEVSQGTNSPSSSLGLQPQSVGQTVGQAVGQQVGELGTEVTRRNLNIQPTIVVRPGYRFFVRVEKDVLFSGPYAPLNGISQGAGRRSARISVTAGRDASGSQEVSQESSQKGGNAGVHTDRSSSGGWNAQGEP